MTKDPTDKYKFPVNPDPELDNKRREVTVPRWWPWAFPTPPSGWSSGLISLPA